MHFKKQKPLAQALSQETQTFNEVTITVMSKDYKVNYHDTVLLDLTKTNYFYFGGKKRVIDVQETFHYYPSFWELDKRLAGFFEMHKTTARFFDWFNFKEKAAAAVGFLFWSDEEKPVDLAKLVTANYAAYNYKICRNTAIAEHYNEVDNALHRKGSLKGVAWLGLIIIGIVAAVVVVSMLTSGAFTPPLQNVTAPSIMPTIQPTPIIIK